MISTGDSEINSEQNSVTHLSQDVSNRTGPIVQLNLFIGLIDFEFIYTLSEKGKKRCPNCMLSLFVKHGTLQT